MLTAETLLCWKTKGQQCSSSMSKTQQCGIRIRAVCSAQDEEEGKHPWNQSQQRPSVFWVIVQRFRPTHTRPGRTFILALFEYISLLCLLVVCPCLICVSKSHYVGEGLLDPRKVVHYTTIFWKQRCCLTFFLKCVLCLDTKTLNEFRQQVHCGLEWQRAKHCKTWEDKPDTTC